MTELARRVDAVVDGALAAERIVGAVVLVSVDGVVVHRRAGGLDDREADIAMRDDAVFRLASVSKLLVATTAMVLVGRGRLGLDDRVDRWLPEFRPRLADGSAATRRRPSRSATCSRTPPASVTGFWSRLIAHTTAPACPMGWMARVWTGRR